MAKKKRNGGDRRKPSGHYCKVCGEHKAHEKFSGKGHAAHLCKQCAALPVAERNEMMAVHKILGMSFRRLSEQEINWLRSHRNDSRPAVRDAAIAVHHERFPWYERSQAKKGLTAHSLELYMNDEIYDEDGDPLSVHVRVFADDKGLFRCVDYNAPEDEREESVTLESREARRFLKHVAQSLNAPFWDEDYSDGEYHFDPYLDILPEYRPDLDDWEEDAGDEPVEEAGSGTNMEEKREPLCSLCLILNRGDDKEMAFYNQVPDEAVELFWSLRSCFEPEELDEDYEE